MSSPLPPARMLWSPTGSRVPAPQDRARRGGRRKRAGRIAVGVVALFVLGLLCVSWLAYRGAQARQHLQVVKDALPGLQSAWAAGDAAKGAELLRTIQSQADAAYSATHDPVWVVAAHLPFAGQPVATTVGLIDAVQGLAQHSLPNLAAAADVARPERLVVGPATIDVVRLRRASASVETAAAQLDQQRAAVQALAPSYLGAVASARQELIDKLAPVATTAHQVATAARTLPPMLGADGPRRYFVGFQNPAELRGTGGLLDAFAIVTATNGTLAIEKVGSNGDLPQLPAQIPGLDPAYVARYAPQGALQLWVNSNLSPDFPEVARAWGAMWTAATRQKVDGAIALDPAALADVLRATGAVSVPGVGSVDGDRLGPLILTDQYRLATDASQRQRKSVMLGVGTATINALLTGKGDRGQILDGLRRAATGNHVLVYSADAAEQAVLGQAGVQGSVDQGSGPFAQAVVTNAAGSKLDSYLKLTTAYAVTDCSATSRTAVVTVTLTNTAPPSGLPEYVTHRADVPVPAVPVGQNRVGLQVLAGVGAGLKAATLDGAPVQQAPPPGSVPNTLEVGGAGVFVDAGSQAGHPSFGVEIELPVGKTRTFSVTVTERASAAKPLMPVQPLVQSVGISADVSKCDGVT